MKKFLFNYETSTAHTQEHKLLREGFFDRGMNEMLKEVGLPTLEDKPKTYSHTVVLKSNQHPDIDQVKAFLKKQDPGFIKINSWDEI